MKQVTIDSGYFNAGIIVEGDKVVDAAPIVNWMVGLHWKYIIYYCRKKGWKIIE